VKYVALLAFNKIVLSHPHLVALHQDVILDCIDDPDISIRLRSIDLVVGMVNNDNLTDIVDRLMRQLRSSPLATAADDSSNDHSGFARIEPTAESDDEDLEASLRPAERRPQHPPPLPDDYRTGVIRRILDICSRDTYANIVDFEWYIDVLTQLVRHAPVAPVNRIDSAEDTPAEGHADASNSIGAELLNVAVRVKSVRPAATRAAESLVAASREHRTNGSIGFLHSVVWIVGEYAHYLASAEETLTSLLHASVSNLPPKVLGIYLQAIPKVLAYLNGSEGLLWTAERKTMTSLRMARVIYFYEPLTKHPHLEIQERAVEFLELLRLASEAVSVQPVKVQEDIDPDPPLLLTQAIPSLFDGLELNPVAPSAQKKVPLPDGLDLNQPINPNLDGLLQVSDFNVIQDAEYAEFELFYHERVQATADRDFIKKKGQDRSDDLPSYQQVSGEPYMEPDVVARRKAERRERNRDDPFYIGNDAYSSGSSTPLHSILKSSNDGEVDIDSIPIMKLDLGERDGQTGDTLKAQKPKKFQARQLVEIAGDDNIDYSVSTSESIEDPNPNMGGGSRLLPNKGKKSLLQVDSSGIGSFSLEGNASTLDVEQQQREEEEMAKAMRDVERLRLEMQRASERVQAANPQGTLVKKKKKKAPKGTGEPGSKRMSKTKQVDGDVDLVGNEARPKKKKKPKASTTLTEGAVGSEATDSIQ
jgi:AP-3 complex subunit delta-1